MVSASLAPSSTRCAASRRHVPSKHAVSLWPSKAIQRRSRLPSDEPSRKFLPPAPILRVDRPDRLWCYFVPSRGLPALSANACSMRFAQTFPNSELFLVGTRGRAVAAEKGVVAAWNSPMPSSSLGIPKLADQISEALYARIATGEIDRLDAVFSRWQPGHGIRIEGCRLFPLDMSGFPRPKDANTPLLNLPSEMLLIGLTADYVHAQLCRTALHAFAAENEARMEAMASARSQIERQLSALQVTQRTMRQEEITAEIIELVAGETASRLGYDLQSSAKNG